MSKAFVETTVLTDFLLKRDGSEKRASAAFAAYTTVSVPAFSWKEFKRGPLANFIWAHNKFSETKSYVDTLAAIQVLSRTPHRYLTSTALQAVHSFSSLFLKQDWPQLEATYGKRANPDDMLADAMRLELKRLTFSAWAKRKTLFGGAAHPLSCYPDQDLKEKNGLIDAAPRDCPQGVNCCLQHDLTKQTDRLLKARDSLQGQAEKRETTKRKEVLRNLEKHPSRPMERDECRNFGDAYFVLFCPQDATLLTNNMSDIKPMADALNIAVSRP